MRSDLECPAFKGEHCKSTKATNKVQLIMCQFCSCWVNFCRWYLCWKLDRNTPGPTSFSKNVMNLFSECSIIISYVFRKTLQHSQDICILLNLFSRIFAGLEIYFSFFHFPGCVGTLWNNNQCCRMVYWVLDQRRLFWHTQEKFVTFSFASSF